MEKIVHPCISQAAFHGVLDKNLKKLEERLGVSLAVRGDRLMIDGDPEKVDFARTYFDRVRELSEKGYHLRDEDFRIVLDLLEEGASEAVAAYNPPAAMSFARKSVSPRSLNQQAYVEAIKEFDLVFGIGPAGTGKTYLAMAMALSYLQSKRVERIVLTRPAVEAGERLGFLPGDMIQKVNPYLRPLYDALFDLADRSQADRMIEKGIIEIAPLAFMRGRTLNAAFIIVDEAQNTTREQMKMILTRTGADSKVVVTADITQIDLPEPRKSGIFQAIRILTPVKEIAFRYFTEKDVVRHPLVQKIIKAYQRAETKPAA